jgi:hypothetical protein
MSMGWGLVGFGVILLTAFMIVINSVNSRVRHHYEPKYRIRPVDYGGYVTELNIGDGDWLVIRVDGKHAAFLSVALVLRNDYTSASEELALEVASKYHRKVFHSVNLLFVRPSSSFHRGLPPS